MHRAKCFILADEDGNRRIVSEDYYYKSDTYYRILYSEVNGDVVIPSSRELLDAFVVPICLEKAKMAGIPVCRWEISYSYCPIPAIAYSLNYYADPAEYSVLRDEWIAEQVIKHITNSGKYPFCYQPISSGAELFSIVSVMGRILQEDEETREIAEQVYQIFRIPLVNIVLVREAGSYRLSSLSPVKYFRLTKDEKRLLRSMVAGASTWAD